MLEQEPEAQGVIALDPGHLHISVNDRLAAPHSPATYAALEPLIHEALDRILSNVKLIPESNTARRAGFSMSVPDAPQIQDILPLM